MKTGRNVQEVIQAIMTQREQTKDFLAPARSLEMAVVGDAPVLALKGDGYALKPLARLAVRDLWDL